MFMGTPRFAVPSISRLVSDGHEIAVAVTQPDRPSGRGQEVAVPPVKAFAQAKGIGILQPADVNGEDAVRELSPLEPELIVVVAFGAILRKQLLDLPKRGCINLHASLLPRLRGVAPINWAIIRGERATGATTMWMNEKVDAGEIIFQRYVPILPEETASELEGRLSDIGSELLSITISAVTEGNAPRIPQDISQASYAPRLKKADGIVEWKRDAVSVCDHIRGVTVWPGAQTTFRGEPIKIVKARVLDVVTASEPGRVLRVDAGGAVVATGSGALLVTHVQPAGKKAMSAVEFARGRRILEDEAFGR
ncbi:MAG: methionyl-tRNA formyltransferase [Candidatus Eisenbacteria bacterium]